MDFDATASLSPPSSFSRPMPSSASRRPPIRIVDPQELVVRGRPRPASTAPGGGGRKQEHGQPSRREPQRQPRAGGRAERLIALDASVAHPDQPVGALHDARVVRREEEGCLELVVQRLHDVEQRAAVAESRFAVGSSASTRVGSATIARTTATRCCCPPESCAGRRSLESGQADLPEKRAHPGATLGARHPPQQEDELGVLLRGEDRDEIVALEDVGDVLEPQAREPVRRERPEVLTAHDHAAGIGPVQAAGNVEQGRLPGPGRPRERHELAAFEPQADVVHRAHLVSPWRKTRDTSTSSSAGVFPARVGPRHFRSPTSTGRAACRAATSDRTTVSAKTRAADPMTRRTLR